MILNCVTKSQDIEAKSQDTYNKQRKKARAYGIFLIITLIVKTFNPEQNKYLMKINKTDHLIY